MKSILLALTWEFWRQAGLALFITVVLLTGQMALLYGGLRLDRLGDRPVETLASLHLFFFVFVVMGLAAVICHSTASPQYRFALPISIRLSVLVPMMNGTLAMVIGYLSVAGLVNWLFHAQWNLVKPTLIAICILSVCQAVAWMIWSSSSLRGAIVAGMSTILGVGVIICLHHNRSEAQALQQWQAIRPLDIALAITIPIAACTFSVVALTLARRGQVVSLSAIGRWLLTKLDLRFRSATPRATPMAAALWSEWTVRGRVMPAGAILATIVLCGFFLSGRFAWRSAWGGVAIFTWLQVMGGAIVGLFLGHVGERFDFHEHLATLPLSDIQLADVKLRNALKSVCWTWILWALGIAVAVICLTLVGQGPNSWSEVIPPGSPQLLPIIQVILILLCSWTLTSLGVSIVILRTWLMKTVFGALALLPAVPYAVLYVLPDSEREVFVASQWGWICLTIGGTIALYVTAFRLRLITARRVAIVGVSYVLFCAAWLFVISFLPPIPIPLPLGVGFLLSTCILPFICVAAVPLAIWWNRHR